MRPDASAVDRDPRRSSPPRRTGHRTGQLPSRPSSGVRRRAGWPAGFTRQRARGRAPLDVLAVVAAGGVLGAEARYGTSRLLPHAPNEFPWSTLLVNAVGCLLIGVLMVTITELTTPHRLARPFLGVGVLGGFTTFSTYAVDIQRLVLAGSPAMAFGYLAGTLLAALLGVWLGATATRALVTGRGRRGGGARS